MGFFLEHPFFITDKNEILVKTDSTHFKGILTINHLIKNFLVSDDNAYNYLFDFLGTDYINKELTQRGLSNTRLYINSFLELIILTLGDLLFE